MTNKTKIVFAILGGAIVGALGTCGIIWPAYAVLCTTASGLVATGVGLLTGVIITTKEG